MGRMSIECNITYDTAPFGGAERGWMGYKLLELRSSERRRIGDGTQCYKQIIPNGVNLYKLCYRQEFQC